MLGRAVSQSPAFAHQAPEAEEFLNRVAADLADKDMNNNMSESNVNTILTNPVQPDCEAVVDNHSNLTM